MSTADNMCACTAGPLSLQEEHVLSMPYKQYLTLNAAFLPEQGSNTLYRFFSPGPADLSNTAFGLNPPASML